MRLHINEGQYPSYKFGYDNSLDIDDLKAKADAGADLSATNFLDNNLDGFDFSRCNIDGSNLSLNDLSKVTLGGHNKYTGITFMESKMPKTIKDADFSLCDMSGTNFRGCTLFNVTFNECDLSDVNFTGATFKNVRINDPMELEGANFSGVKSRSFIINKAEGSKLRFVFN